MNLPLERQTAGDLLPCPQAVTEIQIGRIGAHFGIGQAVDNDSAGRSSICNLQFSILRRIQIRR
jgi:hypothetical protein